MNKFFHSFFLRKFNSYRKLDLDVATQFLRKYLCKKNQLSKKSLSLVRLIQERGNDNKNEDEIFDNFYGVVDAFK
jgi:hypothetical protein